MLTLLITKGRHIWNRDWVIQVILLVMFKISQSRDQNLLDGSTFNTFHNKMGSDSLIIIADAPKWFDCRCVWAAPNQISVQDLLYLTNNVTPIRLKVCLNHYKGVFLEYRQVTCNGKENSGDTRYQKSWRCRPLLPTQLGSKLVG